MHEHLRALASAEGGSLSVERFMREALFHPRFGYYATGRPGAVGRGGDFSTSATLHPALGQALAAWAWHHRGSSRNRASGWHIVELGGGNGQLAAALLGALGLWRRRGLRYHIVEISPGAREGGQRRLQPWASRVEWHTHVDDALRAAGGSALCFSNEFVDAFPCAQLTRGRHAHAGWREVRLAWTGDASAAPSEIFSESTDPLLGRLHAVGATSSIFDPAAEERFADGQRVELHVAYAEWLAREFLPHWRAGRLLTIDYGDTSPGVYRRRPRGTLRAYFRHERVEPGDPEVFARPGRQDLTADVNFSDLQIWGSALGLREPTPLGTLADFLRRWLPSRATLRAAHDTTLRFLLDPDGAGGAFRVLEQIRAPADGD